MKFMLLTYLDERAWLAMSEEEQKREMEACGPHVDQYFKEGKILGGAPLFETSKAKTVAVQKGKRLVTDGPFAETREQLGGYALIEAKDLDEAVAITSAFFGEDIRRGRDSLARIEIRPIVELEPPKP